MNRNLLWAFFAIGIALVAAPLVVSMPTRASAGEDMLQSFEPIMQPSNVATTVDYYDNVFVPLGQVAPALNEETVAKFQGYLQGMSGMGAEGEKLMGALAAQTGMTPEQLQTHMAKEYPSMTALLRNMPQLEKDFGGLLVMMAANTEVFSRVPAGLAHYKPLVDTMETNVDNYSEVSSLPDFNLFTAFFVVPGALLVLLAGIALFAGRVRHAPRVTPSPTH